MLHRLIALAPAAALVLGLSVAHGQDAEPKPAEPKPAEPAPEPKKEEAPPAPKEEKKEEAKKTRKSIGFDAPGEWKAQKIGSERGPKAAYRLEKAEGDSDPANVTLWWFGGKGSWDDNAERFAKMFGSTPDKLKVEKHEANGFKITTGEASGSYTRGGGGKKEPKSGWKGVTAFVEGSPDGPWVASIIGPEKTVEKHKEAFLRWVKTAHPMDRDEGESASGGMGGKKGGKGKKGDAAKKEEEKKEEPKKEEPKKEDEGGDMGDAPK